MRPTAAISPPAPQFADSHSRESEESEAESRCEAGVLRLKVFAEPLEDILAQVLPIWSRQIETSSRHTENSIADLTQRFSEMHRQLQEVIEVSQHGIGQFGAVDGTAALFDESRASLQSVVGS